MFINSKYRILKTNNLMLTLLLAAFLTLLLSFGLFEFINFTSPEELTWFESGTGGYYRYHCVN